MPARMPSSRAALTFVLLSVFIDSLGFGIIIPSLPSVIMQLTGEPVNTAADWGGYLMAVYALLQFFMAPIFGNLSDRFGRRPLLLLSLFAFGVDFLLTGLAKSMTWLFLGRAFAGVFGASYPPRLRTSATSAMTTTARRTSVSSELPGVPVSL